MATKTLSVVITGDASKAQSAFKTLEGDAGKTEGRLSRMGEKISPGMAAAAGAVVAGVGLMLKGAFDAADEAARIGRETERVIRTTGASAWTSADQVADYAGELAKVTGVDDEVIQSGSNLLLTFAKIQNKVGEGNNVFDRATSAALDMSVALGTDMSGAAIQVGKALNDPIKGMTALSRAGVSFTAEQKEQVKALVEVGDTLGAQKVILAELETQFGGAAEAAGTPLDKLKVQLGDLQEQLGGALIPVVSAGAGAVGALASGFTSLPGPVQASVLGIAGVATAGAGALTVAAKLADVFGGTLGSALSAARGFLDSTALGAANLATKMGASQDSALKLASGISGIGSLAGPAVAAVGAAFIGFSILQDINAKKAQEQTKRAAEFTAAIESQTGALEDNVNATIAQQFATEGVGDILNGTSADVRLFGESIVNAGDEIKAFSDQADTGRLDNFEEDLRKGKESGSALATEMLRLKDSGDLSTTQLMELANQLDDTSKAYREGRDSAELNKGMTEAMAEASTSAASAVADHTQAMKDQNDAQRAMFDPLFAATEALEANRDALKGAEDANVGAFFAQKAYDDAVKAHGPTSAAALEAELKLNDAKEKADDANWAVAGSAMAVDQATRNLSTALEDGSIDWGEAKATLDRWVSSGMITEEQARQVAEKLLDVGNRAGAIPKSVNTNVSQTGADGVISKLSDLHQRMIDIYNLTGTAGPGFAGSAGARGGPRAAGGPVEPWGAYNVHDTSDPELLQLNDGTSMLLTGASGGYVTNLAKAGASVGGGGGPVNVTIVMPAGSNGDDVVEAIRRYERRNGTAWRN